MNDIKEYFTCYLVFSQHFSPEFAAKCESVKLNMSVQPSKNLIRARPSFGWPSVVAIAKEELHGWRLQPEAAIAPAQPASTTPAPIPSASPVEPVTPRFKPLPPPPPSSSGGKSWGSGGDRPKCDLCSKLRVGGDMHNRADCFIDPASAKFRPEVR